MSRPVACLSLIVLALFVFSPPAWGQDESAPDQPPSAAVEEAAAPEAGTVKENAAQENAAEVDTDADRKADVTAPEAKEIKEPPTELPKDIEDVANKVDQTSAAKETSAGILTPIYMLAEAFSFPLFHWVAFSLMFAGVVSFAFQLVIGKLVVMAHLGFSPREIISDAFGLVISVIGLVLTTQAAAENSSFTQSPFLVISASVVGALFGLLMYFWGQAQEVEAVKGRVAVAAELKAKKAK
ncbi:hypothetical protein C5Y97_28630 [Blastopirellula marina]|uniref:MotA/TolQ/ExbB proton channel domain-containing protein n=2 Tax=Blastopirellula marina TaxID=124 RepID=A0A2S8F536_9BACT|nr:hypothetical protein C5Y98_28615 [Blastopirellula marina]PTL41415.1 hypothetical protein C5Y97_28630 [Blastopirellula marina]